MKRAPGNFSDGNEIPSLPLTKNQSLMWMGQKLHPDVPLYNMIHYFTIKGELDPTAFKEAFQRLIDTQDALRLVFKEEQGIPHQIILPSYSYEVEIIDLSTDPNPEQALQNWLTQSKMHVFSLEQPLFHSALLKKSPQEYVWYLNQHHLITDGTSSELIFERVSQFYQELTTGVLGSDTLQPQYHEYVTHELNFRSSSSYEDCVSFWESKVQNEVDPISFYADSNAISSNRATRELVFLGSYGNRIEKISQTDEFAALSGELSLFAIFSMLFLSTIYRISGQSQLNLGTPFHGRSSHSFKQSIGLHMEVGMLQVSILEGETFASLAQKLLEASLEGMMYAKPGISQAKINRSYQLMLNFVNTSYRDFAGMPVEVDWIHSGFGDDAHSLCIQITRFSKDNEFVLLFDFNDGIFDKLHRERFINHFQTVLKAFLDDPVKKLTDFSLLTPEDERIYREINQTDHDFGGRSVLQLFKEQVSKTPNSVAVWDQNQSWTYKEIDRNANHLANLIIDTGIRPGSSIALYMDRSPETIVAIWSCIKAGVYYIPMDTDYPWSRIKLILEDATPNAVISHGPINSLDVITIDINTIEWPEEAVAAPSIECLPGDLAYMIYTSGTTGKPKGVMITHGGLSNYLCWARNYYSQGQVVDFPLYTSLAFDLTITSIFIPLLTGGRVVIYPAQGNAKGMEVLSVLKDDQVDVVKLTPSHLALLQDIPRPSRIQTLIVGGENFTSDLEEKVRGWLGDEVDIYNEYGPTETVVGSVVYKIGNKLKNQSNLPIGKPIANTKIHLLLQGQLVPPGVAGEIFISGAGVAKGYHNQLELSEQKFTDDLFFKGSRTYATGDWAVINDDGVLTFKGRVDEQKKINGVRVELSEIRSQLEAHPLIQQAVAVLEHHSIEKHRKNQKLVGYYLASGNLAPSEVRNFCTNHLPDFMIPDFLVPIEKIPLTINGKLDKQALPSPLKEGDVRNLLASSYAGANSALEKQLMGVWEDCLGIKRIGIDDNFFEIGGDSILSIQLVALAKQKGLRFTPKQVFEFSTIRELAQVTESITKSETDQGLISGTTRLTPIQLWFFAQEFAFQNHWNQSFWLSLKQPLDHRLLQKALNLVVNHHDIFRTKFTKKGGQWAQEILTEESSVNLSTYLDCPSDKMRYTAEQLEKKIDLELPNLLEVGLFSDTGEHPGYLFITVHHLVIDAVSWYPFLEDLEQTYHALKSGEEIQLPFKTTSYKFWADYLHKTAENWDLSYWQESSYNLLANTDDYGLVEEEKTLRVKLSANQTRKLLSEVNQAYHTSINDILLTAMALAFKNSLGWDKFNCMLEAHGRLEDAANDVDLSRTVGWFTSMYPVILHINKADIGENLKEIKEQIRATPHDGLSYGWLLANSKSEPPEPDILFNYLGQLDRMLPKSTLFEINQPLSAGYHGSNHRPYALDTFGYVISGELHFHWQFSESCIPQNQVIDLADQFISQLMEIIEYCSAKEHSEFTPSDFKLPLNYHQDFYRLQQILSTENIPLSNVTDIYPLTPTQKGILVHAIGEKSSQIYVEQISTTFEYPFDIQIWQRVWELLYEYYPILKTRVIWDGMDEPLQIIMDDTKPVWEVVEGTAFGELEGSEHWVKLKADRWQGGMDINRDSLCKLLLFITKERVCFLWQTHHLLVDGWSTHIIMAKAQQLYLDLLAERSPESISQPSFRHHVYWLLNQDSEAAIAYWKDLLRGIKTPTPLPIISGSNAAKKELAVDALVLTADQAAAITHCAQSYRVTVNTLVQAAWGLLLSRYSGENDVVFGVTVSGRSQGIAEITNMAGMFINTLPFRVRIQKDQEISSWLFEIQDQQAATLQYEFSSLIDIQRSSELPSGQGLFQSILVFENYPVHNLAVLEKLKISTIEYQEQSNYPLALLVIPRENIEMRFVYDRSRVEQAIVKQMLNHLQNILTAVSSRGYHKVSEIPLLDATEFAQLVEGTPYRNLKPPPLKSLHQLIDECCQQFPDLPAAMVGDEEITYHELAKRSNKLAHFLIENGSNPQSLVGIVVSNTINTLVGIIGILKAGCTYVPIDIEYPPARLAHIINDSGIQRLLTDSSLPNTILDELKIPITHFGDIDFNNYADSFPQVPIEEGHLSYVIYTSGTTGKPKGVMISHGNIVASTLARHQLYDLSPKKFLILSSMAFDSSLAGLYWTLTTGGCLVFPLDSTRRDILKINEIIQQQQVTHLLALPSLLQALLEAASPSQLDSITMAMVAGEACNSNVVRKYFELLPNAKLYNEYGPTEGTVWSHCYEFPQDFKENRVPIGKVIPWVEEYIVDRQGKLVPLGVPGELILGGRGVAQGYLNLHELTQEKFITLPWKSDAHKYYTTGDLVQRRIDGNLLFLGRIDQQVKVRGYRIELEEIENQLLSNHAITSVAAKVLEVNRKNRNDYQIVAYYQAPETLDNQLLREFLGQSLPHYMLPNYFVWLPKMPLNAHGKIDRSQLPHPDKIRIPASTKVAPTTPDELLLHQVWTEVLGVDDIGVHDNFYDLGGDSIISMQIIAQARKRGLQITPMQMFEFDTIAELAAGAANTSIDHPQEVPIGDYGLSPIQQWFLNQGLEEVNHWNQYLWLEFKMKLDLDCLKKALKAVIRHHDMLRVCFLRKNGSWVQRMTSETPPLILKIFSDGQDDIEKLEEKASEVQNSLDIEKGQLCAFGFFENETSPKLLLSIHHLVIDGISWQPLLDDLMHAYHLATEGNSLELPAKTMSFISWTEGLKEISSDHLEHWVHEGRVNRVSVAKNYSIYETKEITTDINPLDGDLMSSIRGTNYNIEDIILTAMAYSFTNVLGWPTFDAMMEGHGRQQELIKDSDLSRTVGWFTTQYPLYISLKESKDPMSALDIVKNYLENIPNKGVSYGVYKYLLRSSKLAKQEEPNVLFNYMGQMDRSIPDTSSYKVIKNISGSYGQNNHRTHGLGVLAYVNQGRLFMEWDYIPDSITTDKVESLVKEFDNYFNSLLLSCQKLKDKNEAPASSWQVDLDREDLDTLSEFLGESD